MIHGNSDERSTACFLTSEQSADLELSSLHLLVFNDVDSQEDMVCVVLDPTLGGVLKSSQVVLDTVYHQNVDEDDSVLDLPKVCLDVPTVNVSRIQSFIKRVQSMVLKMLVETSPDSEFLKSDKIEETLREIQARILSKIDCVALQSSLKDMELSSPLTEPPPCHQWAERRLLSYVDHLHEQKRLKSTDKTMKPSTIGDFVVLEAKELLKLFNKNGLAKFPENCESIQTKQTQLISNDLDDSSCIESKLKGDCEWPNVTCLKYHDLYYNLGKESDDIDDERTKLQRINVGVKETMSTCHVQNATNGSAPVVITRKASTKTPAPLEKPQQLRRSPRKKAGQPSYSIVRSKPASIRSGSSQNTIRNPDEVYKKKLRNAVYDGLSKRGIDETHQLFRPCFKKLFEICKMYAKDMPKSAGNMSTSQWLQKVADQNAETVINLEKSLLI